MKTVFNFDWLMLNNQDALYAIRDYYRGQIALATENEVDGAWWIHDHYGEDFQAFDKRVLTSEEYKALARECLLDTQEIIDSECFSRKISTRPFYHERVVIDILSEEEIDPDADLTDIQYMIIDGSCSGKVITEFTRKVNGYTMAQLLLGQSSDPSFFQLTDHGGDLDEEEEENE